MYGVSGITGYDDVLRAVLSILTHVHDSDGLEIAVRAVIDEAKEHAYSSENHKTSAYSPRHR